jgi:hypothetical protein
MAMSHGARSSVWRNHFNSPRIKQRDPWCTANGSIGPVGARQNSELIRKYTI